MFNIKLDGELSRIFGLSICFMLLFASDTTMLNMQKTVISSITSDNPDFHIDGYTLAGIIYTVFAITVWFGPYINYALGAKLTMILSAIGYLCYIASFASEVQWVITAGTIFIGISAGTLWPAQGCYMIENSSPETTSRNAGIFWFIYSISYVIGNVFVYIIFHGKKYISQSNRRSAVFSLVGINIIAVFAFMLLPKTKSDHSNYEFGPIKTMKKSLTILLTPKMLWMALTFCYAGLQQSFGYGIYGPSVGFTLAFGDSAKELVALSGIFMSVGALAGALSPIVFDGWIRKHTYARRLLVLSGIGAQFGTYVITYINLPDSAVFGNSSDPSIIQPSASLAMLGSVLLSYGDCCLATQVYSFIGEYYRQSSAETCSLYKFVKGAFVAISFYWCNHLGLHTQVAILGIAGIVGGIAFCLADRRDDENNIELEKTEKTDSL